MNTITMLDGPTALIELGGLRLLLDPAFDPPRRYEPRPGVTLEKLTAPPVPPGLLPPLDAVLLSHDQHWDNLDAAGREIVANAGLALTTPAGAERLGSPVRPLERWASVELERAGAPPLTVTAVPAQHGPDGTEDQTGPVTGFRLTAPDLPTVYVSGDNAALHVVETIVERLGGCDVAILNAGATQLPYIGDALLTLSSADAAQAARILGARQVFPAHYAGWAHYTEGAGDLRAAFAAAGLSGALVLPVAGAPVELG
jgi:L-ascorbate metabolism protein UlaG (beta-lactamase superfamily)